jgi:hypothetical protein
MEPKQDPERMRRLLVRRKRHGWSWVELSRRSGLPEWKLHWWRRRLAKAKRVRRSGRAFVPVQVVDAGQGDSPALELVTPLGVSIRVPVQFDADHLRRVLKALQPC